MIIKKDSNIDFLFGLLPKILNTLANIIINNAIV